MCTVVVELRITAVRAFLFCTLALVYTYIHHDIYLHVISTRTTSGRPSAPAALAGSRPQQWGAILLPLLALKLRNFNDAHLDDALGSLIAVAPC